MSEPERLLPHSVQYGSNQRGINRLLNNIEVAENEVKVAWAKAVRIARLREVFAEFLATFILVTIGNGAIAQVILSENRHAESHSGEKTNATLPPLGTELSINVGYGFGVMLGAYVAIGVSGAHMNPAVTLAMALRGKLSWIKVIPYWGAQFLGAFFSSAIVYGVYIDALESYKCPNKEPWKSTPCTATIFATYPQQYLSLANGFLDQTVGTFLLLLGIFAICDSENAGAKKRIQPFLIGLLVWAIGGSFGFNCGYAINPARDFGPRVFTAIAGWGKDVFVCSLCPFRHWWWVPIVAPMLGAAIASFCYWFLIDAHHQLQPRRAEDQTYVRARKSFKTVE